MGIFSIVCAKLSAETCAILPHAKQCILSSLYKSHSADNIASLRLDYKEDILTVKGGWSQVCQVHKILQDLILSEQADDKHDLNIQELAAKELSGRNVDAIIKDIQDLPSDNEETPISCELSIKKEAHQELDDIAIDIHVVDDVFSSGKLSSPGFYKDMPQTLSQNHPQDVENHALEFSPHSQGSEEADNDLADCDDSSETGLLPAESHSSDKDQLGKTSPSATAGHAGNKFKEHLSQFIHQLQEKRPVQLEFQKNCCPECYIVVDSWDALEKHFLDTHSQDDLSLGDSQNKILKCSVCKFTSNKRKSLKYHVMRTHWEKGYECSACHKKFGTQRYMTTHFNYAHKKPSLACMYCDKKLKNVNTLKTHIKIKHNEEPKIKKKGKIKPESVLVSSAAKSASADIRKIGAIKKELPEGGADNSLEKDSESGSSQDLANDDIFSKEQEGDVVGSPNMALVESDSEAAYLYQPAGKCKHCEKVIPDKTEYERHQIKEHLWMYITQLQQKRKIQETFQQECCPECYIVLEDVAAVEKHFRMTHVTKDSLPFRRPGGALHCTLCYFSCTDRRSLKFHAQRKHWEKRYACFQCGKKFATQRYVNTHIRNTHRKEAVSCDLCGRELKNALCLKMHIQIVHEKRERAITTHLCGLCGKVVRNTSDFTDHMNKHNKIKAHKCETCGKAFYQRGSYRMHLKIHQKASATFICEICGKAFHTAYLLKVHGQAHISKCYSCDVCDRSFAQRSALSRHKRIHTGEKPYPCQLCEKRFGDYSILRRHVIGVHKQTDKSLMEKAKKYNNFW